MTSSGGEGLTPSENLQANINLVFLAIGLIGLGAIFMEIALDDDLILESIFLWWLRGIIPWIFVFLLLDIAGTGKRKRIREELEKEAKLKEEKKAANEKKARKKGYTSYKDYRRAMIEEAKEKKREEELRLEEEQEARRKEEEAEKRSIAAKKAAKTRRRNKILKEREKIEKPRKEMAFSRDNFQSGHGKIGMSQRDKVWNSAQGVCQICLKRESQNNPKPKEVPMFVRGTARRNEAYDIYKQDLDEYYEENLLNAYTDVVSFYWTIHPSLQVMLLCDECAANEGLVEERPEIEGRSRHISTQVKREVFERDAGKCVQCGSAEDLHFDHDVPFSLGGSNEVDNIQLLCHRCNLSKGSNII